MVSEICQSCGQHIPCRAICVHCGVATCEVKGQHAAHWHKSCARNAELAAHWGGPAGSVPVMVGDRQWMQPVPVATGVSMTQPQHTGQIPAMQSPQAGHQHTASMAPTVIQQGSEPPADLPAEVLKSLG